MTPPDIDGLPEEKGIEELIADLSSESEEVRRNAVQVLSRAGDRRALEPLKRLTNDPSVSVRFTARKAIGAIEKRLASSGPAGESLDVTTFEDAKSGDAGALSRWRERLESPDKDTRLRVVLDVYDVKPPDLLPALVGMFGREPDEMVRSALVSAIGRYRDSQSLPVLFQALEDPDSRVRANAVDALARFRDSRVIEHLAKLADDPDNRVQANLARALGQFDAQFLHDQVAAMLASGTPWMRESALYVLWAVRDEWCKGELDFIASNPSEDPEFREKARRLPAALQRLSRPMTAVGPSSLPPAPTLESLARPEDATPAPVDIWSAATVQDKREELVATEDLPAMESPAPSGPDDVETLLIELQDKSAKVKLAALQRAVRFQDERVWQMVEMLSMEKNDAVRAEARRMLKDHYGDDAVMDLSSAALSTGQRPTLDLSTAAMKLARREDQPETVEASGASEGPGKSRAVRQRKTTTMGRTVTGSSAIPPMKQGLPPWALGLLASAAILAVLGGLSSMLSSGGDGAKPTQQASTGDADPSGTAGGGSKLAQIAKAKDLGKYIGLAVPLSGKLVDAKNAEGRYIVESAHGKVAVQFVRPVANAPAVGEAVEVDGVLLGKTREGFLLLRGRKIQKTN